MSTSTESWQKHGAIENKALLMTILVTVLITIGGLVEIVPMMAIKSNVPTIATVTPYSPLELEGRDLYIREGCYNCHSQMIRPFRAETMRYGEYSKAGEFVYDHPHQWGSKRTGPDLQRVGGKYPDAWHYRHMEDPKKTSAGSIMPRYGWLLSDDLDTSLTTRKLKAMVTLGVPYTEAQIASADADRDAQAAKIATSLKTAGIECAPGKEIIAMIAYLQRLGVDGRAANDGSTSVEVPR
jgi:cytochrome c oxidase cbb3-type subunit I/II